MKKIFALTLLAWIGSISSLFFVSANPSVQVSAIVGIINHSPLVTSLSPSSDPKLLGKNKIQNYTLSFRDDERDTVSYTITPAVNGGYTNIISGTIHPSDYNTGSGAYINFTYLSPASSPSPNPTTITVTLSDGYNLVNKDIHLYIY